MDLNQLLDEVIRREGGYVNDPDDPGGPTKYGVTVGTMRRLRMDLNRDGLVNAADVKLLTVNQAKDIFRIHYLEKPKIDQLPVPLQPTVMDMYINAGSNAVKILQRMINKINAKTVLKADGIIGPNTLREVKKAYDRFPPELFVDAYGIERRNYYYRIGDRRAASRKYARRRDGGKGGWIKRAEEFIRPRYHLTDAQHRERTRHWV